MNRAIILNKIFDGSWNDEEGNISHEIIDFALTDEGKYFVYNVPYGCCPKWIHIKGDIKNKEATHEVDYLYLTSESRNGGFSIKYRIKLIRKLHDYTYHKTTEDRKKVAASMEQIYEKNHIYYGGKKLSEILDTDTPLITFEAAYMETATEPPYIELSEYNYQRNKGYLKEDEYPEDFKKFLCKIENAEWIRSGLNPIVDPGPKAYNKKTFLDLIRKSESEECYTNILYSVLKYNDLFEEFCKKFASKENIDYSNPFNIFREYGIVGGRIDICAENISRRVVIENKLYSGLNGIKKDSGSQLRNYYNWGLKNGNEPLCFLTVPDFRSYRSHQARMSEIEQEIKQYDPDMLDKYIIVTYGEISKFILEHKDLLDETYEYHDYRDDIIFAFNNYAYASKTEYVQSLFLNKIRELPQS